MGSGEWEGHHTSMEVVRFSSDVERGGVGKSEGMNGNK